MNKQSILKIVLPLSLLFSSNIQAGSISLSGACACNSAMAGAFSKIDTFIVDNNLVKIHKALIEDNKVNSKTIDELKIEKEKLTLLLGQVKNETVYLSKIAFLSEQEKQIRAKHKISGDTKSIKNHKN